MKKSIVLSALSFALVPIFASEHGFRFRMGGLSSVMLKPYAYEQVGYSYKWNSGLFLGGDIRFFRKYYSKFKRRTYCTFYGRPDFWI